MIDAENKIQYLKKCLGAKKLKQLGLIPCSTCSEIVTQVSHIFPPPHLKDKPFLNAEETASLSQTILEATKGFLKNSTSIELSSQNTNNSAETITSNESQNIPIADYSKKTTTNALPAEDGITIATEDHLIDSTLSTTDTETNTKPNNVFLDSSAFSELLTEIDDSPVDEKELLSRLLSIINQSHHIAQNNVNMGYIYTPPTSSYFSALSCSECGRLYTISTSSKTKLIALPVYLSDTEYEMIKGIYVDTLL